MAKKTNTDPKVDYFEEFDPRRVPGSAESGAFMPLDDRPDVTLFHLRKNRRGPGALALEFRKDFAHSRFDPAGTEPR